MAKNTAFQLDQETHARTLSLLEEIKSKADTLDNENEARACDPRISQHS